MTYLSVDCDEKAGTGEEMEGVREGSVKPNEDGDLRSAVGPAANYKTHKRPNPRF